MLREQQESTWPALCILVCLFVVSVGWPRTWEDVARQRPIDELLTTSAARTRPVAARPSLQSPLLPHRLSESAATGPVLCDLALEMAGLPSDFRAADPAAKLAGPSAEFDWSKLHLTPPIPATRQVVRNRAVFGAAETPLGRGQEPALEQPLLAAGTPSPIDPLPHQRVLSPGNKNKEPLPEVTLSAKEPTFSDETAWQQPEKLLEQLDDLACECETGEWAMQVSRRVRKLVAAGSQSSDEVTCICSCLETLLEEADELAGRLDDGSLAGRLRSARGALCRRLEIWEQVTVIGGVTLGKIEPLRPDPQQLALAVTEVESLTGDSAEGRKWQEYLLLEALWSANGRPEPAEDNTRRPLAQRILRRLTGSRLTAGQRRFLTTAPLKTLVSELQRWAAEPLDLSELLRHLERYELTGAPGDARLVAKDRLWLATSPMADRRELGRRLEAHYCKANVRLVLTEELLNRLIPQREPEHDLVYETILGRPVRGQSLTSINVAVRLVPDPNRLRLALEVTGEVASRTSSTTGPATFYNNSRSTYTASKQLEIDTSGLRSSPAEADAHSVTRLRSLRTNFDAIPLVGSLVQGVARSQHEQKRHEVKLEIESKVAARAKLRIDSEADAQFADLSRRFQQRVFQPMANLELKPTMTSAHTTDRRLSMQLCLAGQGQLGSHTLRPWAPSDSQASLQIHESALNNVLQRLELGGKTFTMAELRRRVATRLGRPEMLQDETEHDEVKITFAAESPIQVQCEDDRIVVTLSIAELSNRRRHWRDFQARAFYHPHLDGLSAELVRDGVVRLKGRRLSTGSQFALRSIFSKTFSKNRPWKLTPGQMTSEPKMADLAVTQFVIDGGWIGLALGPKRGNLRPAIARR